MNQLALELHQLDDEQLMEMFDQVKTTSPFTSLFEYEVNNKQALVDQIALTLIIEHEFLKDDDQEQEESKEKPKFYELDEEVKTPQASCSQAKDYPTMSQSRSRVIEPIGRYISDKEFFTFNTASLVSVDNHPAMMQEIRENSYEEELQKEEQRSSTKLLSNINWTSQEIFLTVPEVDLAKMKSRPFSMPINLLISSIKRNNSQLIQAYKNEEKQNSKLVRLRKKKERHIDQMIKEVHEKHNQKKWENHLQKVSSLPFDEEESLESDEDDGTDPDSKDSDDISNPLASSENSKALH